jgi:TolB-like protein
MKKNRFLIVKTAAGIKSTLLAIVLLCTAITAFGQETVTLDEAINDSMSYFVERLQPGTKVAVLNFNAYPAVADYVIEEITVSLVNDGNLTVVDRSELELLRKEMDFQLSGEVSDESAQSIGKKLGAQTVISGSLSQLGAAWRMRIRALEVETAAVQGIKTYTVRKPSKLLPKTAGEKVGTGALNMVFGLGSYLEGDIAGGLTITAGWAAAAGLFIGEALLDWDSPAAGVPATIGVAAVGLSIAYGFARPFIYNRAPQALAFLDNMRVDVVPASGTGYGGKNGHGIRLSYTVKF